MKLFGAYVAVNLALCSVFCCTADPDNAKVEQLSWLAGCWEMVSAKRIVEERWMPPRGQTMLGTGRTISNNETMEYEFIVLRANEGRFVYEAHPSEQPSASFFSTVVESRRVIFENLEHDFPQRIGYEKHDDDTLLAWIEGSLKGKVKKIEFPYRRAPCS
jgi:hypothetical protein